AAGLAVRDDLQQVPEGLGNWIRDDPAARRGRSLDCRAEPDDRWRCERVAAAMSDTTLATALSAAEDWTIGMIADDVPLPKVLDELCRTIDALIPGVVSTVLLMDPDGKRLWPGGAPGFPDALRPAINPWWIGPGRGACGTSAFLKERVIIADVTTDPRFP